MESGPTTTTRFKTDECELLISHIDQRRVLVVLSGRDSGRLGREPFQELEKSLNENSALELFFDLRAAVGATLEVSGSWAVWLRKHRQRLHSVSMLTGRPIIGLSAKVVKSFAELGDKARIYSDAAAFEGALRARA